MPWQQAVARMQLTPGSTHLLPTFHSLCGISWLSVHLTGKDKQRITADHRFDVIVFELALDSDRLGLRQTPNQFGRSGILNGLFIDTADLNAMGDGSLFQKSASCRGR